MVPSVIDVGHCAPLGARPLVGSVRMRWCPLLVVVLGCGARLERSPPCDVACSETDANDSAFHLPPPCPVTKPASGAPCETGQVCNFPGDCDEGRCVDGQWTIVTTPCPPPPTSCPRDPPTTAMPCGAERGACHYYFDPTRSDCRDEYACVGSSWMFVRTTCAVDSEANCSSSSLGTLCERDVLLGCRVARTCRTCDCVKDQWRCYSLDGKKC